MSDNIESQEPQKDEENSVKIENKSEKEPEVAEDEQSKTIDDTAKDEATENTNELIKNEAVSITDDGSKATETSFQVETESEDVDNTEIVSQVTEQVEDGRETLVRFSAIEETESAHQENIDDVKEKEEEKEEEEKIEQEEVKEIVEIIEEVEKIEETEQDKGDDLTEGEKMLLEIDTTKAIVETDTELEYPQNVMEEISRITLHQEELPEIRGLSDLEYESPEESIKEEISEEFSQVRRKSVRPSIAARLLAEEVAEKKRKARKEMTKEEKAIAILEEEESIIETEPLTKEEYYAIYDKIMGEMPFIKMKSRFLQRKIGESFKKRKMEHALREEQDLHSDVVRKYEKKLDRLANFIVFHDAETAKMEEELDAMRREKEEKYRQREELFNRAVNREREIGTGLINTKTGKEIPDKVVDHLIKRQINAANQITELRLKFIWHRNEMAEKTAELKSLDNIGDNLSLMDYEQLKIENRAHSDKLEEKEEELTKLRVKCRNTVQIMAHVREKCAALDADMDVLKEEYEEVHYQYIEIRERLNFCKTERDVIRNKTMKLKAESGLLTKPKLLKDMETSMQEVKLYEETLERVKKEYNEKTQQIRNLRKNIANEMVMSKKQHREKKKKKVADKYYKIRPTLIVPKLPKKFLHHLTSQTNEDDN